MDPRRSTTSFAVPRAGPSPSFDTRHAPRAPPSSSPPATIWCFPTRPPTGARYTNAASPDSTTAPHVPSLVVRTNFRSGFPRATYEKAGVEATWVAMRPPASTSKTRACGPRRAPTQPTTAPARAKSPGGDGEGAKHARARGIARERGNFATVHIDRDGSYREHFQSRVVVERARVKRISLVVVVVFVVERASNIRRGVCAEARTSERDGRVRRRVDVVLRAPFPRLLRRGRGRLHRRGERRLLLPGPRRGHERRAPKRRGRSPRHQTRSRTRGPVDRDVRDEVQTNVSVDGRGGPREERKRKRTGGGRVARRRRLNHERSRCIVSVGVGRVVETNAAGNRSPRQTFGSDRATDGEVAFPAGSDERDGRVRRRGGRGNAERRYGRAQGGPFARAGRGRGARGRWGKRGCQGRDAGSGVEVVSDVDGGESARGVREGETRPVRVGEGVELDEHIPSRGGELRDAVRGRGRGGVERGGIDRDRLARVVGK